MAEVGRNHHRLSDSTLDQAGPLRARCPWTCPSGICKSPGRRFHNPERMCQLCQRSITCAVNKVFLIFRRSLLCSYLCLLPLVLSLGITEKSLDRSSIFFVLSLQMLIHPIFFLKVLTCLWKKPHMKHIDTTDCLSQQLTAHCERWKFSLFRKSTSMEVPLILCQTSK